MSNQKTVFKLAETVLFNKKGNTKTKRDTMQANHKILVDAFKNPRTLFMHRDAPCLKLLCDDKEGWRTTLVGSESSGKVNGRNVMTVRVEQLAYYGKQTQTGFKIVDRNLKNLWDAIVNFVKIYGEKICLKGDLEMQQASMLYWLNQKYAAVVARKEAASIRATEAEALAAKERRKQEKLEYRSAMTIQRHLRGWYMRSVQARDMLLQQAEAGEEVDDWEDAW